jgi:hypothetical protein
MKNILIIAGAALLSRCTWLLPFAIFLVGIGLTLSAEDEAIPKFKSVQAAREAFEGRELCLLGKLLNYTDYNGKPVNPANEVVQGMEFEVIWNLGEKKEKYWVHICGGIFKGEVYGPVHATYALTTENLILPEGDPKPNCWPWGGCADHYRIHQIEIEGSAEPPSTRPSPE